MNPAASCFAPPHGGCLAPAQAPGSTLSAQRYICRRVCRCRHRCFASIHHKRCSGGVAARLTGFPAASRLAPPIASAWRLPKHQAARSAHKLVGVGHVPTCAPATGAPNQAGSRPGQTPARHPIPSSRHRRPWSASRGWRAWYRATPCRCDWRPSAGQRRA